MKTGFWRTCSIKGTDFKWHKAFLDGCESVEDAPHYGRPCTSKTDKNVTKVRALMRSDWRLTVRMIRGELNLNHQTVHKILTEKLGMWKICAKPVPKNLTNKHKEHWRNVCLDLLECIGNDEKFFEHVITGDESWIFEYDPETKRQSLEWHTSNSLCPKKARMSKPKIKSILICFFDSQGSVHKEFVPQGQTVLSQGPWMTQKKGSSCPARDCGHLDAASWQCSL
jgi:hypothetical protein